MTIDRPDDGALLAAVQDALTRQRWFPAKGSEVTLRPLGRLPLPEPEGVRLAHLLVAADTGDGRQVLQVPLTVRERPLPQTTPLGTWDGLPVYEGPHDPAWVAAMLDSLHCRVHGPVSLQGRALGRLPGLTAIGRVLEGEQSNTSVIIDIDGPHPAMFKLFRVLPAGSNPEVEVGAALTRAGCRDVPPVLGWLEGAWPAEDDGRAWSHLAVLTGFLPGSRDAWKLAVDAAAHGRDLTEEAAALGAATARVHAALLTAFGPTPATGAHLDQVVGWLRQRVDWALDQADVLAELAGPLRAHRDGLAGLTVEHLGQLQRIHGDLHLGQVLALDGGGWSILDFEGEPLRPLAERTEPDLPLRDVAGVLRSFHYAAAVGGGDPSWADACGAAFVAGYGAGGDPDTPIGRALLLDKALYEVVYEVRNRPDWVHVPLTAVRSLLAR